MTFNNWLRIILGRINIRLRGVRDGVEGSDLRQFLEKLFTAYLGVDSEITIQVLSFYRVGGRKWGGNKPRDIVVELPNWHVTSKILSHIWEQAGFEIEGSSISACPDISIITLRKKRHFQFLITILKRREIKY